MNIYDKCIKCNVPISSNNTYCTACLPDENNYTRVKLKARTVFSIFTTILLFITNPIASSFAVPIALVSIFTITSILNIKNELMRTISIMIAIWTFMTAYYMIGHIPSVLVGLIYTALWAFIARSISFVSGILAS